MTKPEIKAKLKIESTVISKLCFFENMQRLEEYFFNIENQLQRFFYCVLKVKKKKDFKRNIFFSISAIISVSDYIPKK